MIIRRGITRTVWLVGAYAIKIHPNMDEKTENIGKINGRTVWVDYA